MVETANARDTTSGMSYYGVKFYLGDDNNYSKQTFKPDLPPPTKLVGQSLGLKASSQGTPAQEISALHRKEIGLPGEEESQSCLRRGGCRNACP